MNKTMQNFASRRVSRYDNILSTPTDSMHRKLPPVIKSVSKGPKKKLFNHIPKVLEKYQIYNIKKI